MFLKRKKQLLALLLAAALLAAARPAALAADYPCTGHTAALTVLRKTASESGEALLLLPAGDAVYVTGESGGYYIVEYDGVAGYVAKAALNLGDGSAVNLPSDVYGARYSALYRGSEGQAVADLQSALIELGYLSGKADGKYGAKTAEAVSAFQQKNGLNATGSADAATQGLLFEGRPLNSRGTAKSVSVAPDVAGFPVTTGKQGELVSRIQTALKALDYYSGKVDGKYGTGTMNAVKKFQQKNGLNATGVADAAVQTLLFGGQALSAKATATPKPTVTPVPPVQGWENGVSTGAVASYPYQTETTDAVNLRKGASTSSKRLLTVPKGAQITVLSMQGDFLKAEYNNGKKTYTGYVMARYVDVPAIYYGGDTLKADAEAQKKYIPLSQNAAGQAVSTLQDALRELGFYNGMTTGLLDAATVSAVKALQSKNGLLQTGFVSAELQKLIYEGKPRNSKGKKTAVSVLPPIDGVSMQRGDTGYQVTALQQRLKEWGYLAQVTGEYDAATVQAVKDFQKENGLSADGVAGERVLAAIDRKLITPTPPLNYVTPAPTPLTEENVIVIHSGTRGLVVTRLQQRLVELGYYSATPDGIYNGDDIAAVKQFQKQNGLKADGVAGLETQQRLYDGAAIPAWATPIPAPTATPRPQTTDAPDLSVILKIGSRGEEVLRLQERLIALNYLNDTADGRFGTKTAAAVSAFQRASGLTADGIAGPKTLKKLYESGAPAQRPAATAAPSGGTAALSTASLLRLGDKSEDVRALQQVLISLGYLSGGADGIYGTKTYLAVRAFQKANRLGTDGVAGPATLTRLQVLSGAHSVTAAVTPVPTAPPVPTPIPDSDFKAPTAAEVRFADWYSEIRTEAKLLPNVIIYDYVTGLHYTVNMFSFGKHADAEPLTDADTQTMYRIMGKDDWTPHAVWVVFSDGRVYMASTHSYGHDLDNFTDNGLTGHICIHFPREMTSNEKKTMPYALRHQQEIIRGWEETQSMIR